MADALLMRLKDPKMFQDYSNEWSYAIESPYTVLYTYLGNDTDIIMPSVVSGHKTAISGYWLDGGSIPPDQVTSLTFPRDYAVYCNDASGMFSGL